jgi:O-antigen/teichoic acid export membrane protein
MEARFSGMRTLVAEFLVLASGNALGILASIAMIRLLTEHMSTDAYGKLALALTFGVLVNQIYMARLANASARLFASAKTQGESAALFAAIRSVFINHTGQVIVLGAMFGWISVRLAEIGSVSLALAVTLVSLIGGINAITIGILNAARWRASVAILNTADPLIRLAVIACWIQQDNSIDPATVLWIQAGSGCACMLIALFRWRTLYQQSHLIHDSQKRVTETGKWKSQLASYGRPLAVLGAIAFVHQMSDRWALNVLLGPADVGLFAALYQLGFLPFSLLSALALSLFAPILFEAAESRSLGLDDQGLRLNLAAGVGMLLITLGVFCIGLAYGEPICRLALGEQFRVISPLLPWALLSAGLFETGQLLALHLQAKLAMKQWMWIKGSISCLGIVMNVCGVAYAGVAGLIWAMLTFSLLYLTAISAWILVEIRRRRGKVNLT